MASVANFIKKTPDPIKKILFSLVPFGYRYGREFRDFYRLIKDSNKWSYEEKRNYQLFQLKRLLKHSEENIPYYKNKFQQIGFKSKYFKSLNDIENLPYLTKDIIRNNSESFVPRNFNKRIFSMSTSGSTGKKLNLICDDNTFKREAAFVLDSYHSHGATLYDKKSFWLRRYVPKKGQPLNFYDSELKRMYMSAYHINENTIHSYFETINSDNYHTLVGYPSSIFALCQLAKKFSLKLDNIKAIHTSSEMMLDHWFKEIESYFKIKPISHYGSIEKVCFFKQCGITNYYEENPLYGYSEFIKNDLGTYDVIGTGFINYVMPLIRYRTEDQVELDESVIQDFKAIKKIHGRSSDILVSSEGSRLPGVNFYSWVDKSLPGVGMFQVIQNHRLIEFKYVPSEVYNKNTYRDILLGLEERLGNMDFKISKVDEIKRDKKTGKIRTIINKSNG